MFESITIAYETRYGLRLVGRAGEGRDGEIFLTNGNTAVKFFKQAREFGRELRAYEILAQANITEVAGHAVPKLKRADESLRAIEMSFVPPPFLLDFASAYPVADAPDFSEDVWDMWHQQKAEEFGERWPDVQSVLAEFQRLTGLVLLDVNPGNIRFAEEAPP